MSGTTTIKRERGRPQKAGKLYEIRYRSTPGLDAPEVIALLDQIVATEFSKRQEILRAVLHGSGITNAQAIADNKEDSETTALLDDMFGEF